MKVAFYTLGCKTNQYETQALEGLFAARGHTLVPFDSPADVYVVNTCTVTALADKKSRAVCRRAKRMSPASILIVCGCYSQVSHQEARESTGADLVLGVTGKGRIVELAELALAGRRPEGGLVDALWDAGAAAPAFEALPAGGLVGRTRALLKVQDGCQNFCTYCKIPFARGPSRSAPLEVAVRDAALLSAQGYHEIVVTGIEISSWGADLPGNPTPADLIEGICAAAPEVRIRLGSLEPRTVTEGFAARLAKHKNLCPHFHLSLQSGSDAVLAAMNRHYTASRYAESCDILRAHFPGCAITADLIVGFPGETEDDFVQSLALLERCRLAEVHVFPFSRRAGTRAYDLPNQLTAAEKTERAGRAAKVVSALRADYLESCVGRTLSVLFETETDGLWIGHAGEYVPVTVASAGNLGNRVRDVAVECVEGDTLRGKLIPTP